MCATGFTIGRRSGIVLLSAFLLSCSGSSTQDFLDANFLKKGSGLQVKAPRQLETDTQFVAEIGLADTDGNLVVGRLPSSVNCSVIGNGTITQLSYSVVRGAGNATLVYTNPVLAPMSTDTILVRCADGQNSSVWGQSEAITVRPLPRLASFRISAPQMAYAASPFSITITAIGTDGLTYASYNGSVNLSYTISGAYVSGTLSPATATSFTAGVATVSNTTFSTGAASLTIHATDSSDSTKKGNSNLINVYGNDFTAFAVPMDVDSNGTMDAMRINFTRPSGASSYKIYHDAANDGNFTLLTTVFAPATYWNHTSLTVGQTYTYRVDVFDGLGNLIRQSPAQAVLKNCTVISGAAASVTTSATWTAANSPFCINSNVTVSGSGTVLTIEPGAILEFKPSCTATGCGIQVSSGAAIRAVGSASAPILFTSASATPAAYNWPGIWIDSTAQANNLTVTAVGNEALSEANGTSGSAFIHTFFEYTGTPTTSGSPYQGEAIRAGVPTWIENSVFRVGAANPCTGGVSAGITASQSAGNWVVIRSNHFISNYAGNCGGKPSDVMVNSGRVVLRYNSFRGSVSETNGDGGAIQLANTAGATTIQGNSFYNTISRRGGGAIVINSSNNVVKDNLFSSTSADGCTISFGSCFGGAIYVAAGSNLIKQNTFLNTYAPVAGAISIHTGNGTTIESNLFRNTSARGNDYSQGGGAIYILPPATGTIISENTFDNCTAQKITYSGITSGGAIESAAPVTITRNSFYSNRSTTAGSFGGAIYLTHTGAVSGVNINYNHFRENHAQNTASNGGAIALKGTNINSAIIVHNNFISNLVVTSTLNSLYTEENATFTVDQNYWGTDLSAAGTCSAAATYCQTGAGGIDVALTNNRATAWPLCCSSPHDTSCVGVTNLPSGMTCH